MLKRIMEPLRHVQDFVGWYDRLRNIFGYLSPMEGYALKLLASSVQVEGEIVEIGSFMGKSTCWLAAGIMNQSGVKVNAVDHFKGSPEHQAGQDSECSELVENGSTLNTFKENIRSVDLEPWVNALVGSSEEIVRQWTNPIRLLFIDGDHAYDASKKDFELWSPFVVRGGVVAFHDISCWDGVTRFYRQLMAGSRTYQEMMKVESLAVIKKIGD